MLKWQWILIPSHRCVHISATIRPRVVVDSNKKKSATNKARQWVSLIRLRLYHSGIKGTKQFVWIFYFSIEFAISKCGIDVGTMCSARRTSELQLEIREMFRVDFFLLSQASNNKVSFRLRCMSTQHERAEKIHNEMWTLPKNGRIWWNINISALAALALLSPLRFGLQIEIGEQLELKASLRFLIGSFIDL